MTAIRESAKRRWVLITELLDKALSPKEAKALGLVSQTKGFYMKRWDFSKSAIICLREYQTNAPDRNAQFVRMGKFLVEVWAKPMFYANNAR